MAKKVYNHEDGVRLSRYRDEFEHASVEGKWRPIYHLDFEGQYVPQGQVYAIYSYGYHFPMYVYDPETGSWYGNKDKYSNTTTRHQSKYRPSEVAEWFDTTTLQEIIKYGFIGRVTQRLAQAHKDWKIAA